MLIEEIDRYAATRVAAPITYYRSGLGYYMSKPYLIYGKEWLNDDMFHPQTYFFLLLK